MMDNFPPREDVYAYAMRSGDPFITAAAEFIWGTKQPVRIGDYMFSTIISYRYPMNNVLRHLYALFVFRILQNAYYNDRSWIYPLRYTTKTYVNRRRYARLFMPLFDANVFARMAELDSKILRFLTYDTELLKSLPIARETEQLFWAHNPNAIEYAPHLGPSSPELDLLCSNPHWTDETMIRFVENYSTHIYTSSVCALCLNNSISLDCLAEIFRILNRKCFDPKPGQYVYGAQSFEPLVADRFDYPPERLNGEVLSQNSTADHIDTYVRRHTGFKPRLEAGKHPNMSDRLYAKLMNSKRMIFIHRMLSFDRTDVYYILRYSSQFSESCNRRIAIERFNEQWKHVLDRQLELAKNPGVFFPKTTADLYAAIDSFAR